MNISPILWPEWWIKRGWKTKSLVGMPFIGPHVKIWNMIEEQLIQRNEDCLELWGYDPQIREIQQKASEIMYNEVEWPNAFFIPTDILWLLLGLVPGDETEGGSILNKVCKVCGVQTDELPESVIFSENSTFGDLVNAMRIIISEKRKVSAVSGRAKSAD